jgi:hypothetical protein
MPRGHREPKRGPIPEADAVMALNDSITGILIALEHDSGPQPVFGAEPITSYGGPGQMGARSSHHFWPSLCQR